MYNIAKELDQDVLIGKRVAVYGTGKGAEEVLGFMADNDRLNSICAVVDEDHSKSIGRVFHGFEVKRIRDIVLEIDAVIVAANYKRNIICKRLGSDKSIINNNIIVIDAFRITNKERDVIEYAEYIEDIVKKQEARFIPFDERRFCRKAFDTKVIAWYLPQFHRIDVNDFFHGTGFTEWNNTSRMIPLFTGHYQPHIPYDVGYYDLLNPDSLRRQIFLAKHYGIYGFCIHYYWFSGDRLMEKPIQLLLEDKGLDIPFCFNWATENWTMNWDGGNYDIIYEQKICEREAESFMDDIIPYMLDDRYIKIDGKPLLTIYKCKQFIREEFKATMQLFREYVRQKGFPDLYILLTTATEIRDPVSDWGCDGMVEYHPLQMFSLPRKDIAGYVNPHFAGDILDTESFIREKQYMIRQYNHNTDYYRSALTSWDNSARKCLTGATVFQGLTPETYKQWLLDIIIENKKTICGDKDIVFVNSWNEWAEGSHLEPDYRYGYAYLNATREAIEAAR